MAPMVIFPYARNLFDNELLVVSISRYGNILFHFYGTNMQWGIFTKSGKQRRLKNLPQRAVVLVHLPVVGTRQYKGD
jgi:hypothetical protein